MLNSRSLDDLRPDVRVNVESLLKLCKKQELNVLITQTKRDNEYQAYLYAQGRTRSGSIITNSKTTTFHGAGLAIDFCQNIKGYEYADKCFFQNVATIAKHIGFSWGGDWKDFVDRPHLQWDCQGRYTASVLREGIPCPLMPEYKVWEEQEKWEKEEELVKRYQTLDEIKHEASWAVDTVSKLIERGVLKGDGNGLDLSADMLRLLVINDRAGLYQ
jgi:peptidoglycan L-alanyl-D-glutamate endopeptidase CwlK